MLTKRLHQIGLRSWQMEIASMGSIGLCIGLWIRAKMVDQDDRGSAVATLAVGGGSALISAWLAAALER